MKSKRTKRIRPVKTVGIVDDDEAVCDSLAEMINSFEGGRCAGALHDPRTARRDLPGLAPDVVMIDIRMQWRSGIEVMRDLKQDFPDTVFLIITALSGAHWVKKAVVVGAKGYLLKPWQPEEILKALSECAAGREYVSRHLKADWERAKHKKEGSSRALASLTRRQWEILELLKEGQPYEEMADELGISPNTLRQHLHWIYQALGVSNRTEALKRVKRKQEENDSSE